MSRSHNDLYGNIVKIQKDEETMVRRKVMKGFEDIDGNIYFVTPVVKIDNKTHVISTKTNKNGYHEIVKIFKGSRVDRNV